MRRLHLLTLASVLASPVLASSTGINGASGNPEANNGLVCSGCHVGGGAATVTLQTAAGGAAPTTVAGGTAVPLRVQVSGGGSGGGFGLSILRTGQTNARFYQLRGDEPAVSPPLAKDADCIQGLTHAGGRKAGGTVTFAFSLITPHFGGNITVYGTGLSTNGAGTAGDGFGRFTQQITVTPSAGPPLVDQPAAVSAGPNGTYNVQALGIDNSPETALTYTWAATGPGTATFTPNASNAAKNSSVSVMTPGLYTVTVTIRDPDGQSVTSSTQINVGALPSKIIITPESANVPIRGTQQFTASALDQFSKPLIPQPKIDWSCILCNGTINKDTGLFTASGTAGGPFTVVANLPGSVVSSATIYVISGTGAPPTISKAPTAVTDGFTALLSVAANDDGGEDKLTYTWSKVSGPGAVALLVNGTNAAKTARASFDGGGAYRLAVQVRDATGLSTSATVDVTISGEAGGDIDPPTITATVSGGATLSSEATLTAQATDNVGVVEVRYELDGAVIGTATADPWMVKLDPKKYPLGEHSLVAVAKDAAMNEGRTGALKLTFASPTTGGGGSDSGGCSAAPGSLAALGLLLSLAARRRRSGRG